MSLGDVEIAKIVDELAPRLAGQSVGKAWLRDDFTLVIEVGRERLLISAHPRASRLHMEDRARPKIPPPPPRVGGSYHTGVTSPPSTGASAAPAPFAMAVRRRLGNQRVASLTVPQPGERIVVLEVGPSRERLIAELTGPHANLFLVGPDDRIGATLRRSTSTTRALSPGHPYTPPPPAPADARWRGRARFADAAAAAEHYTALLRAAGEAAARERAAVALRREIERLSRLEKALRQDLARADEAAGLRKHADLLLAHAHELHGRGASSVVVPDDFEDGTPLTITLDPALDARQNAARLYKQHKRLGAGRKRVEARLAQTRTALAAAEEKLAGIPTLPEDELPAPARAPAPRRKARDAPRLPYREYASAAGDVIWVGRGAADNDTLTFRHARGADLWFHCRDARGAHVVVPVRSSAPVKDETFLDAATLAAHFSDLAGEQQVDVMVTHVKHLRRPRGAPAGRVFASDTRTVRVRMEPERLARLLARADAGTLPD